LVLSNGEKKTLILRWLILTCGIIFLLIALLRKETIVVVVALGLACFSGLVLGWLE